MAETGCISPDMTTARPRDAATLILVRHDGPNPRILMGQRSGGHDFMPDKWVFPGGRIDRGDYGGRVLRDLPAEVAEALAQSARLKRQDGPRLAKALAMTAVRETFEETGLVIGRMQDGRLEADLAGLSYVARAITPPARHKRFDARFLMADARHLASLEPTDSRELAEVAWFTLDDCRQLDLPLVTRAVLDVVQHRLAGGDAPVPFWRWTRQSGDSAI
jgi:8-oxo-dGTP pyrophosphatase MutT (NUDIX family)